MEDLVEVAIIDLIIVIHPNTLGHLKVQTVPMELRLRIHVEPILLPVMGT
jgi:hypothetical protein